MKVLMVDVGGTNVKIMASGHTHFRKIPSEPKLTAAQMVKGVLAVSQDLEFDVVSMGFPGLVRHGQPSRDPLNLGGRWVDFDYEKAFGCPVRIINDAAMQALASYQKGRMLFIGLGTSIGATLIADDAVVPIEVGLLRLSKSGAFAARLCKASRNEIGHTKWEKFVWQAVALLRDCFWPDDIVIGGGNAKTLQKLPEGCRIRDNQDALRGALRLWPGADMIAEPLATTWRIRRPEKRVKKK
jgi:predicted NBD/HSP70 family sugar kinase